VTVGSLFAGIGGFDLGFERAGFDIKWQVEIDPYCRAVLAKHWPEVKRYTDVRELHMPEPAWVDVVCGGFPCQPVSIAGAKRAQRDERWLWPEFARLVDELRPNYVVVENVPGLLIRGMDDVLGDLAGLGYDAEWQSIPAAAVGAPHLRWRVWIVAYASRERRIQSAQSRCVKGARQWTGDGGALADTESLSGELRPAERERSRRPASGCDVSDAECTRLEGDEREVVAGARIWRQDADLARSDWWAVEPDVGRVAHGVPARVDRLRGLGNAIVPQIAQWIAERIHEAEAQRVSTGESEAARAGLHDGHVGGSRERTDL
jgi:DNA (cytosine-5)-methyltransferase 1